MAFSASELAQRHCKPCEEGAAPLGQGEIAGLLRQLDGWAYEKGEIRKDYAFPDYCRTMAFVNAIAWISHREDHHPELEVGYKRCRVRYATHAVGGLSENDFVCAAKVDKLFGM